MAVLLTPVVLENSAKAPVALFWLPMVLLNSPYASGCILIANIGKQGASAHGRVEAARRIASERKETNCRVVTAGGKAKQRVLSFCRVASGITAVRRWNHRPRLWQKP